MDILKSNKTAIIIGSTGLIGRQCLSLLLESGHYQKIVAFTRRSLEYQNERLDNRVIDFDHLEVYADSFGCDDLYICFGSTIAKAGSKIAFKRIDYEYPFKIAKYAKLKGCNQLILVSSIGASVQSLFFYTKIKGKLEESILSLNFWSTHILRPSVLIGMRNERRIGESLFAGFALALDKLGNGVLGNYRPIRASDVARAMVILAQMISKGKHIHESNDIIQIANQRVQSYE